MSQTRRRRPKYRHVAPALALMTTVVIAMAGITVSRLARIPSDNTVTAPPAAVRVRLSGLPRAEAAGDVPARVTPADAVNARPAPVAEPVAATAIVEPAPEAVVEAESPTLAPGTLMVGLAAARSRTLASASPRPAPPAECDTPVAQNFDADIVGMTGVPGRKMYYGRSDKNSLASACRRGVQAASETP